MPASCVGRLVIPTLVGAAITEPLSTLIGEMMAWLTPMFRLCKMSRFRLTSPSPPRTAAKSGAASSWRCARSAITRFDMMVLLISEQSDGDVDGRHRAEGLDYSATPKNGKPKPKPLKSPCTEEAVWVGLLLTVTVAGPALRMPVGPTVTGLTM